MRSDSTRQSAGERGQALPFMLIWIVLALAVIAMAVTVGQSTSRRGGLQLVADAGAYTGASSMAVGFNSLAKINGALIELWNGTKPRLRPGITCAQSAQIEASYFALSGDLARTYQSLNRRWQSHPLIEARRVTTYNAYDLFPGEGSAVQGSESDRSLGVRSQRDTGVLVASRRRSELHQWSCQVGKVPVYRANDFPTSYEKADDDVRSFVWVVRARAGRPLLGDRWFGRDAVPSMTAAAAAKPVGGSIREGRPTYVTKMIPLASLGLTRASDGVPRVPRPVTH